MAATTPRWRLPGRTASSATSATATGRSGPRSPPGSTASPSSSRTCGGSSTTSRSTSSRSPRRTTGTRWRPSGRCRPARTCTSRSRSATTSARADAWSRSWRSTSGSARAEPSIVRPGQAKAAAEYVQARQARPDQAGQVLHVPPAKSHGPAGQIRRARERRLQPLGRPRSHGNPAHTTSLPLRLALDLELRKRRVGQQQRPCRRPDAEDHRPDRAGTRRDQLRRAPLRRRRPNAQHAGDHSRLRPDDRGAGSPQPQERSASARRRRS